MHVIKDVTQFFKLGPILLRNVQTSLLLYSHNNEVGNRTQNFKRIMTSFGPLKNINPTITHISYGNSVPNHVFFFPNQTSIYYSDITKETGLTVYSSPYNEMFEPISSAESLYIPFYDPRSQRYLPRVDTFPLFTWTNVFTNFITKCTCIGVSTLLNLNSTKNGNPVMEGIGVFYDIKYLNQLLDRVILQNTDMQTKNVYIALVERNSLVVATSNEDLTKCIFERRPLSTISDHFKLITESLLKQQILSDTNYTLPIDRRRNKTVMHINGIRVSTESYGDGFGLDLVVIVSTTEYGFIKIVLTSSPILLSISIILMVLGTVCMFIFTHLTTRAILKVSTNMFNISNMQISKVMYSKFLNIIFELKLLQNSCRAVQRVQVGFSKYIPKEIVREIVVSEEGTMFGGMEHLETTLMFTDIADFTNLSESISISSLLELLEHYFTAVTMSVERNGGIIDKFIGDGTMSIFSHPLRTLEQHPLKACKSALESLMELEKLNSSSSTNHHLPSIGMRIGINSGMAAIGNIGSIDRLNYTAIGDCVNTASRLESLCKRYNLEVLIGEATYESVKQEYLCFFVDTVKLKGKDQPIDIYLIETEWSKSNTLQKQVHDALIEIRNYLHSHQFQLLIDKVNSVKEYYNAFTPSPTTTTTPATSTTTIMEAAAVDSVDLDSTRPPLLLSNMYFLELLVGRANVLTELEKYDQNVDHSLTLTNNCIYQ